MFNSPNTFTILCRRPFKIRWSFFLTFQSTADNITCFFFSGTFAAVCPATPRSHGDESRYRRAAEAGAIPQNLHTKTRKREVRSTIRWNLVSGQGSDWIGDACVNDGARVNYVYISFLFAPMTQLAHRFRVICSVYGGLLLEWFLRLLKYMIERALILPDIPDQRIFKKYWYFYTFLSNFQYIDSVNKGSIQIKWSVN